MIQEEVSTFNSESTVIDASIGMIWKHIMNFQFDKMNHLQVTNVQFTIGEPGKVESIVKESYADGSDWIYVISSINTSKHSIGYDLMSQDNTKGNICAMSFKIKLHQVSETDQTYLKWTTTFSNEVSQSIVKHTKEFKLQSCYLIQNSGFLAWKKYFSEYKKSLLF